MSPKLCLLVFLVGCSRGPTEAQCQATWDHVGEVTFRDSQKALPEIIDRIAETPEQREEMIPILRDHAEHRGQE